eukprot:Trichotokara_eunicae@DN4331_c0_g1_i2.p1
MVKIRFLEEQRLPVMDHAIVKWFILNVLKTEPARNARLAQAHLRYIGALERMIAEKIVLVEEKFKMKDRSWRTIKANERICPLGWWYDQVSQSEFEAETVTKIVGQ